MMFAVFCFYKKIMPLTTAKKYHLHYGGLYHMNFKSQWLPYATDFDVEAVKRLSRSATDDLKDKINSWLKSQS